MITPYLGITGCRVEGHNVPDPKNPFSNMVYNRRCYTHDRAVHDQGQSQCDIGQLQKLCLDLVQEIHNHDQYVSILRHDLLELRERYERLDAFEQKLSDLTSEATRA